MLNTPSILNAPPSASSGASQIPLEEVANATATRLFRRALEVDSSLDEARVRLARLLEVDGHDADAVAELEVVFQGAKSDRDPITTFYGHLFAARADAALHRTEAAVEQASQALALFPTAQSALLARSLMALQTSDSGGALAVIDQLKEPSASSPQGVDPWLQYDLGPGRDADRLLAAMRTKQH